MNYDELENPNAGVDKAPKEKTSEDINQNLPPGSDPNDLNQPISKEVPDVVENGLDHPVTKAEEAILVPETPQEIQLGPDWSAPIAEETKKEHIPVVNSETIVAENTNIANEISSPVNEAGENDN